MSEKVRLKHAGDESHPRAFQLAKVTFIPVQLPAVWHVSS